MSHQQWHETVGRHREWIEDYEREERRIGMKTSEMMDSKYLKQSDVDGDVTVTIRGIKRVNVAQEDQPEELKWIIGFHEMRKPMVLNSTNIQLLERFLGDETDDWKDKKVILYVDPNVSFGGKLTGGIRVKQYKFGPKAGDLKSMDDDIPF